VEESESMATEPAEPVSAHPSPAGRPTSLGGPGVEGPEDSSLVGVSALGYPSGPAGPSEISVGSEVQVSPYSLAMGIAETRTQLEAPSTPTPSSSLRQPPVAATETAAAQGLTLVAMVYTLAINAQATRRRVFLFRNNRLASKASEVGIFFHQRIG